MHVIVIAYYVSLSCWQNVEDGPKNSIWVFVVTSSYRGLPDTSATRHSGTLRHSAPVSRHLDTKNVVRDTSTRVPWSRKSRNTSTQDNSDETQLHRWFGLNFCTNFVVPKCLSVKVSCGWSVWLPNSCFSGTLSSKICHHWRWLCEVRYCCWLQVVCCCCCCDQTFKLLPNYPVPDRLGDGVLFSVNFIVCMYLCLFISFFVSLLARLWKTAGPICMKFSGKVWSDHGTTWLHFTRCRDAQHWDWVCCAFAPQLV